MPKRMSDEEQQVLDDAAAADPTVQAPPGEPAMVEIRALSRDDGNIGGKVREAPKNRINVAQHEFAPLVRKLNDEEWRQLANSDQGVNWRIIQQYEV